jgi:cyclophilin family peptidyl-prolyl cis-trans isomerase/protein-disulfide isomerase
MKYKMKPIYFLLFLMISSLSVLMACSSPGTSEPQIIVPSAIVDTAIPAATCAVVSTLPTPIPNEDSLIPAVSGADFSIGSADAPVTLIEYCDFQSTGCRDQAYIVGSLLQNHDDLRFVFRPIALGGVFDKAEMAFLAAMAADEQGKFWAMYNLLFTKHAEWAGMDPDDFDTWLAAEASAAGMDSAQLIEMMGAPETTARMASTMETVNKLSLPAVPLILINGTLQPSYLIDPNSLNDTIGLIALGQKQFGECPAFTVDAAKNYIATIHTDKGDILIELYADKAPLAVNSFVFLARQGWFEGVSFHRVIPGFVAQSGDPSGTGRGNPGYFFKTELSDLSFDSPGLVAMANTGPDTNGSQFFITFAPAPHLNGGYTIFGRVISGLEVAEQLTPRNTAENPQAPMGDKILSVEIEEK